MAHIHEHAWRIAYNLPTGLANGDGWVPKVLIRACRTCNYAEALFGAEQQQVGHNRLYSWEAWTDEGLVDSGNTLKWKRS